MDQVFKCKRRSLEGASLDGPLSPELAREFLDNFCKHYQPELFDNFFINIKLMYLIPDLISTPEVRIDPSTMMLYYVMLYHGALNHRAENKSQTGDFMRRFYVQCLRFVPTWEKHAAGSKGDLITAILLARAAFQQCDMDFSWNMHKLVCLCAVKRNMHVLDKDHPNTLITAKPLKEGVDQYRKGFWGLVHTDLVFRLLHDKPAMLTADVANWHVNLPAVEIDPELPAFAIPDLAFLVRFRLVLHLLRFYEVTGRCSGDEEYKARCIENLCEEIQDSMKEWPVADLMTENENTRTLWWVLYEVTLAACCSVMIISQELTDIRARLPDHTSREGIVSPHPLSVKIARQILHLASEGMNKVPITPTASVIWGLNRCYMAYGCLVQHLAATDPEISEGRDADLDLLKDVTRGLAMVVETDSDLMPLLTALVVLNATVQVG
ncbi:unnamed protein product [Clonostachys byssicola]|uniref:Transcription factor domain-containing protein n=1 Tax=Clonostachys byssicola TaxID=160290 RepID=A0A9N9U7A7_9HYPO|nr:unnamed protein product [Clonostachys byssicola]